jgi:lysozyme
MSRTLIVTANSTLKVSTAQSSAIALDEKFSVAKGDRFLIDAWIAIDDHIKFTIARASDIQQIKGRNTWYIFASHCQIEGETIAAIAPTQFRPNSIAVDLICEFEGLELKQYYCPANFSTIGYGSTRFIDGGDVPVGAIITEQIARDLLQRDLKEFVSSLRSLVNVKLTGKQIAALTSFVYNLGAGALAESTLLKRLNAGESREAIAAEFLKWDKADGQQLPGLTRRRRAESDLWVGKINAKA